MKEEKKQEMYEAEVQSIFKDDVPTTNKDVVLPGAPINGYRGFLNPIDEKEACMRGKECIREIKINQIADFEKTAAYCEKHDEILPDLMVHVSTFVILDDMVYMTYYASNQSSVEEPASQRARLAMCPLGRPEEMRILEFQKAGDTLEGRTVTALYDTILMYKGGEELYLMWTAAIDGFYYRFYRIYYTGTEEMGPVLVNRFKVGEVVNDFSTSGIISALAYNNIPRKHMFSDIGIMQKLSTRIEDGETWYYTGAYSGDYNCIIKSRDFITWEYVSAPDFVNFSLWENATYVLDSKCYYFVRQKECRQGFLTCFDLVKKEWEMPVLISDDQSRSDFIFYRGQLYLVHAPVNREGFGIIQVNQEDISRSRPVLVADMQESIFYPFVSVYGDDAYISYTVDRKHIRLSRFDLRVLTSDPRTVPGKRQRH